MGLFLLFPRLSSDMGFPFLSPKTFAIVPHCIKGNAVIRSVTLVTSSKMKYAHEQLREKLRRKCSVEGLWQCHHLSALRRGVYVSIVNEGAFVEVQTTGVEVADCTIKHIAICIKHGTCKYENEVKRK